MGKYAASCKGGIAYLDPSSAGGSGTWPTWPKQCTASMQQIAREALRTWIQVAQGGLVLGLLVWASMQQVAREALVVAQPRKTILKIIEYLIDHECNPIFDCHIFKEYSSFSVHPSSTVLDRVCM